MICTTEGIVLKTFDFRETSRIATFFTKDYGKIKGVLKGIRKDYKKFGSSVDRFSVNDVVYYQYRNSDLHLISQCDLKQFHFRIRKEYRRNIAAHYMLELVDSIMPLEHANKKIYRLMLNYLSALEQDQNVDKLVHIFQIKILTLSGFRPHIETCVICRRKITEKAVFSTHQGGLLCYRCPHEGEVLTPVSRGTIASMLHIEGNGWLESLRLGLTRVVQNELKFILNNFLVHHLGKNVRSARYL